MASQCRIIISMSWTDQSQPQFHALDPLIDNGRIYWNKKIFGKYVDRLCGLQSCSLLKSVASARLAVRFPNEIVHKTQANFLCSSGTASHSYISDNEKIHGSIPWVGRFICCAKNFFANFWDIVVFSAATCDATGTERGPPFWTCAPWDTSLECHPLFKTQRTAAIQPFSGVLLM
jgi:hypothetical protein